jgi:hypothetical protein
VEGTTPRNGWTKQHEHSIGKGSHTEERDPKTATTQYPRCRSRNTAIFTTTKTTEKKKTNEI